MKELLQQLGALIPSLHGWSTYEKSACLCAYVCAMRPEVVVEIGVWGGRSAIPMMLACKQCGRGRVICIDPWKPDESVKGQENEADQKWWSSQNHEFVFQHFLHTLEKLGLKAHCEVWRNSSGDAPVPSAVQILHIDGNHGPQALADTIKFAPTVTPYGICVLDDLEWSGGFVRLAERWLLDHGFIMLHTLGTGAVYLRIK